MRRFSSLVALAASFLVATACTGARNAPASAPQPVAEPAIDPAYTVSHPVEQMDLVRQTQWDHEQFAREDSAIMRELREAVDFWNTGNLDRFISELYGQSATYVGSAGPVQS